MLKEKIKQELDNLSENQLQQIADFITFIQSQAQQTTSLTPFWQRATPTERAEAFRNWVSTLPQTGVSLSDEAISRDSIYEE